MGRAKRKRPARLPEKLKEIRFRQGLSQPELIERLRSEDYPIHKADISNYESGKNEPPLMILLRYARLAGVTMDTIVDDHLDLPERRSAKVDKNL